MMARPAVLAATLTALLTLTACGGDDGEPSTDTGTKTTAAPTTPTSDATGTATETPEPAAKTLAVKIRGDKITPVGASLELGIGEKVVLTIDSDRAGELHVHSTPEKEIGFDAGTSRTSIVIDRPGVVDVEEHEAEKVIVQLEVS